MTTDQQALLKAIAANSDDDTPRLVYADWLDENRGEPSDTSLEIRRHFREIARGGEPDPGSNARAEFIRLQIAEEKERSVWAVNYDRLYQLQRRIRAIFQTFGPQWAASEFKGCRGIVDGDCRIELHSINGSNEEGVMGQIEYKRGCVRKAKLCASYLLEHKDVLNHLPIQELTVINDLDRYYKSNDELNARVEAVVDNILAMPYLSQLRELDLTDYKNNNGPMYLYDAHSKIKQTPALSRLTKLSIQPGNFMREGYNAMEGEPLYGMDWRQTTHHYEGRRSAETAQRATNLMEEEQRRRDTVTTRAGRKPKGDTKNKDSAISR